MFDTIKKNKYYSLYTNLSNFKNLTIFNKKYDNLILQFPYKDYKSYKDFINFIFNDDRNMILFKMLSNHFSLEDIIEFINNLEINFNELNNIFYDMKNKKKIILGIIWNILGFYLSNLIIIKLNIKKNIEFRELIKNKYYLFLTSCYIYYDDLLDNKNYSSNKNIILDFTNYFFKNIDNYNHYNDLFDTFLKNKNISKDIFKKVNSILVIFFLEYKKDKNKLIYNCVYNLFKYEIICSKNQKTNKNILESTMIKSYLSILTILQIILKDIDCKNNKKISDLIFLNSLISQLLDDLNDIQVDISENTHTLFTKKENFKKNILKLIKLIHINNENYLNFLINLTIFSYGLSKIDKLIDKKLYDYSPFSIQFMNDLRIKKNIIIEKINFNKTINKKYLFKKISIYHQYLIVLNNSINKIFFLSNLKREIYLKKKYIKNLNIIYNNEFIKCNRC